MAFGENEKCFAFHGPLLYEAKVLKVASAGSTETIISAGGHPAYRVHYKGWKQSWDEWVPEDRLMKFNEETVQRQRQLNEAQRAKDAAERAALRGDGKAGSAEKGKKAEGRGTKRGRDSAVEMEEEYAKRPEIKIVIPEPLKIQLVDDWENVTKNNQLVTLPRTPTVVALLKDYESHALSSKSSPRSKNLTLEVLAGLVVYFDRALGHTLLYRSERQQYAEVRKRPGFEEKPMSEVYGAEHLLRLFVNLPEMIAHTTMDTESVSVLRDHLGDILRWMTAEQKRIFQNPYDDASPAYQNINRGM